LLAGEEGHAPPRVAVPWVKERIMWDVAFLAIGLGWFAVCLGYTALCDRL
jgi:hypothetical protein